MAQRVLRIEGLPDGVLDAAAAFHADWLPRARPTLDPPTAGDDLVLVFAGAPDDHRGWRLAAIQALAREAAPRRVNGVAGGDDAALAAVMDWLAVAPAITGQLLALE